ncbi:HlyD family efflux transporter periplasmic adaptor subunit [Nguyenibacter vanlangensis]|uniref:HlyD family efflux transporter periplasmic adaptor subunit n=1 Tax=Nguyenibacter vanlangensis TaxID=1216886 RepID=A0ABZ3D7Y7_9PROT
MADGSARPLFRAEALKWHQEAWIGSAQLVEPISGRIASLCSVVLVATACFYVAFGTYTRRIHANGLMLPPTGLVVAEADQSGIVASTPVKEGMHVTAGDRLFTLDVESWSEAGPTGRQSLDDLAAERDLLTARRALLNADAPVELESFRDELTALEKQQTMLTEQVGRDNASLPLVERAMSEMRTAIGTHLVTESQFQSQLYTYVQFMNTHSQTLRTLVETGGQISDLRYKIDRHRYKVDEDLNDLDVRLADIKRQIAQARGQAGTVIDARVSGTVDGIRASVGQRVAAGQPLASILPDNAELLAELYVDSRAVGFVRPGQHVLLKYAAYPFQRFGLYDGTVVEVTKAPLPERNGFVSRDNGDSEANSASPRPQGDTYRIRVRPDRSYVLAYGQQERLTPGMAVEAEIAIDRRRLYQWLLDPVISMTSTLKSVSGGPVSRTMP